MRRWIPVLAACAALAVAGAAVPCPPGLVWTRTVDGPTGGWDGAGGVAMAPNGDIIAGGAVQNGADFDWQVRAWDSAGNLRWTRSSLNPSATYDDAAAVAANPSGSVYAVGTEDGGAGGGGQNLVLEKYDGDGGLLWRRTYTGPGDGTDQGRGVAVDGNGDVLVTGATTLYSKYHWLVLKYDADGTILWTRTANFASSSEAASCVATDSGRNVIVGGTVGMNSTWRIIKYDPAGTVLWSRTAGTPLSDGLNAVTVEGADNVIAGGTWDNAGLWRVAKYDPAGNELWARTVITPGAWQGQVFGIAVDTSGRIFAAGSEIRDDIGQQENAVIRQIDPATGQVLWTDAYNDAYNGQDGFSAIGAGSGGFLAAGGYWGTFGGEVDWHVRRFSPMSACLEGAAAVSESPAWAGRWATVWLTVTNGGSADATGVAPSMSVVTGAALVTQIGTATPAGPVTVTPGSATTFAWTFSVSGSGAVVFDAGAVGTDSSNSLPVAASATAAMDAVAPAAFVSVLSVVPASAYVVPGQWITVTVTVSNTGDAAAASLFPVMTLNGGTSLVDAVSGPVPADLASLAAHGTTAFVWTWSVSGAGTLSFTVSVTGTDTGIGNALETARYAAVGFTAGARPVPQAFVDAIGGLTTESLTLRIRVENVGAVTALNVTAGVGSITTPGGVVGPAGGTWAGGSIALVRGPDPSGTVTLGPGGVESFAWEYAVTGHGTVSFGPVSASGVDGVSGAVLVEHGAAASVTYATLEGALSMNLPPPGKLQIRNAVVRVGSGTVAHLLARGRKAGGSAEFALYSRAGLPLGRIGAGPVAFNSDNVAHATFDGTLDGKSLSTGVYWVVTGGDVADRHQIMVVNDR